MKNTLRKLFWGFGSVLLMASCSTPASVSDNSGIETRELTFSDNVEPLKGKTDVYISMARAAKYNANSAGLELKQAVFDNNKELNARDLVRKSLAVRADDTNPLFDAVRELDFAILYAVSRLGNNPDYNQGNFFRKAAQNQSLQAIKEHKDTLFSSKKVKEISRLIDQQQKALKEINARFERQGKLSQEDLAYRKGLEVALLKLQEIRSALVFNEIEYATLIKTEPKELDLEGKKFYELDDFDKKLTVSDFANAAVRNRSEFSLAKEVAKSYNYDQVNHNLTSRYPDVARLQVNGYDYEDKLYVDRLSQRATKVAEVLVAKVMEYEKAKAGTDKQALRIKAFDELGVAVFTQIEAAYDIVQIADLECTQKKAEINKLTKEIKNLEKYARNNADRLTILNEKIKLLEKEIQLSRLMADRAVAIRALYFYAGFSPFNQRMLNGQVKDIALTLKEGFQGDAVKMLASVQEKPTAAEAVGNEWAKQENWLEKVVEKQPLRKTTVAEPIVAPVKKDVKVIQLGAYSQRENATYDWNKLSGRFNELAVYSPEIETVTVNGTLYHRLLVKSSDGKLGALCQKLKENSEGCLEK